MPAMMHEINDERLPFRAHRKLACISRCEWDFYLDRWKRKRADRSWKQYRRTQYKTVMSQ